jgi:hypothetical protein
MRDWKYIVPSFDISMDFGLEAGIRISAKAKYLSLHSVQTASGPHLASFPMGTGGLPLG